MVSMIDPCENHIVLISTYYTSVSCEKKWRNFCVSNITILVRKGRGWSRHNLIQLYRVFSFSFSSLCFVFAFLFLPWMQLSPTVLTITKQDAPAIACSQALPVQHSTQDLHKVEPLTVAHTDWSIYSTSSISLSILAKILCQ